MTVSVFASFHPQPDSADALLELLAGMVADTRKESGCLRYDLFSGAEGDNGYHLYEIYADPAALEAHLGTEHYKAYRAAVPDLLTEPVRVIVLDPVDAQT